MIPGVNPRQLKQMMRQLGMSQEDIDAVRVVIETSDKKYVFEGPQVQRVVMQGQESFQVIGNYFVEEVEEKFEISDEDVEMVVNGSGVSRDVAKKALEDSKGDIAKAIINLEEKNNNNNN